MIFLDLVGGGGRAKSSFVTTEPVCDIVLFLDNFAGDAGDTGRYEESEPLADDSADAVLACSASRYAVGGRSNRGAS